ncbi:BTB/POZ domain-containing protein KCTD15 [Orchesella cincta]|uniref:BTB/POZ domain-containing protein KCTD15 n=1 Tax=Orchesella cincta TaxID=48709 RepID=A0A1D2NG07_ORCCI|nr:BTB/POZ domain-containing protein KCTD15 [Orchesella cincta]
MEEYGDSRLAKLFNGSIPIVLDSLKQHYFIDRDGKMFRHILNFVRNNKLLLPADFTDIDLLLEEARFFEIQGMYKQLEQLKKEQSAAGGSSSPCNIGACGSNGGSADGDLSGGATATGNSPAGYGATCCWEVLALNISPDLGERIMLSGERALIEEAFPETGHAVMDARSTVAWHHDARHVIRFPLNGYCKLNSVQAFTRLLNMGYQVTASHGGGVDSQQFSEYLFIRKAIPL